MQIPLRLATVLALLGVAGSTGAANPARLAAEARLDLMAQPAVGALVPGAVTPGSGNLAPMNWIPPDAQPRSLTAHWPIVHFRWSPVSLTFIPTHDGLVDVDLLGPWTASPAGPIYQQEVLWDAVTATGATVTNGSFETLVNGVPAGWSNPWSGPVNGEAGEPAPPDGARAVSVWHDRRLRTTLAVTAGLPVTLSAWVRAHPPDGYRDNPRIAGPNTPAHAAARGFRRGINFSNHFEPPPGADWGGGPLGPADYDAVRAEGFDHVRLPVRWNAYAGPAPDYAIDPALFDRVDTVVTNLLARGLNVIVNVHHFDEFTADPSAWTDKLVALWDQIAAHYATQPDGLAFEILNEPHTAATTEVMNAVYARLLPRLRATNPQRAIFVGPGQWNSITELPALRLPAHDANLVVTVHSYAPFLFTHQGASWAGPGAATTNVVYPGPPPAPLAPDPRAAADAGTVAWLARYNRLPADANPCGPQAFEDALRLAHAWSVYYGRPVHVGEFGAYTRADGASRARFCRDMRLCLETNGLGWAMWDWKAGFNYWDRDHARPLPGMRAALFGSP